MVCPYGGFLIIIRHNEVRDLTATLLTEVCHNVATEPSSAETFPNATVNTSDDARLDVKLGASDLVKDSGLPIHTTSGGTHQWSKYSMFNLSNTLTIYTHVSWHPHGACRQKRD